MKLEKREFTTLTPSLAKHYLEFNDFETQRPLRNMHIAELAEKMRDGRFRFGEVAFGSLNGGKEQMMNGQHICHSVIEYGKAIECVVEHYSCANRLEISELFRQFEIMPRSLRDFVRHEANALKIKWPLWVTSLVVSAAAIQYIGQPGFRSDSQAYGFRNTSSKNINIKSHLSKEKKVKLLENYLEEGEFISDILTCNGEYVSSTLKRIRPLRRAPVVFLMMETWRVSIENAKEFWVNVRDGEGLVIEMAEYQYREFLKNCHIPTTRKLAGNTSNHEYIYRGHLAWNAYREGRTTTLAYRVNALPPKLK